MSVHIFQKGLCPGTLEFPIRHNGHSISYILSQRWGIGDQNDGSLGLLFVDQIPDQRLCALVQIRVYVVYKDYGTVSHKGAANANQTQIPAGESADTLGFQISDLQDI